MCDVQPSGVDVPGVLVNVSRSAAGASPAARHLLQDLSDDGVNLTISITAPASQLHNISDLVQGVVGSAPVRRQLREAGEKRFLMSVLVLLAFSNCDLVQYTYSMLLFSFAGSGDTMTQCFHACVVLLKYVLLCIRCGLSIRHVSSILFMYTSTCMCTDCIVHLHVLDTCLVLKPHLMHNSWSMAA